MAPANTEFTQPVGSVVTSFFRAGTSPATFTAPVKSRWQSSHALPGLDVGDNRGQTIHHVSNFDFAIQRQLNSAFFHSFRFWVSEYPDNPIPNLGDKITFHLVFFKKKTAASLANELHLLPRASVIAMRKNPASPKPVPQEFLTIQYPFPLGRNPEYP